MRLLALAAVLVAGGIWLFSGKSETGGTEEQESRSLVEIITTRPKTEAKKDSPFKRLLSTSTDNSASGERSTRGASDMDDDPDDDDDEDTPDEKAVKHWEKTIAVFYEETEDADDGGNDNQGSTTTPNALPKEPRVTLDDQLRIRDAFREMSEESRMEEVHHAMNLLPDESVAVMYGVLFDKTQPEEIMDVIFSDILNRDEAIKNPMMREIKKDKDHPMYTESARILDVIDDDE